MSSLQVPSFVENYYSVDVPPQVVSEYPTPQEIVQQRDAFFNQLTGTLDLGYLAITRFIRLEDNEILKGTSRFQRELKFDEIQTLAAFTAERTTSNSQIIQYSKRRLLPETIEAILAIHKVSKIIG